MNKFDLDIYCAPEGNSQIVLGKTIAEMMEEAWNYRNPRCLNYRKQGRMVSCSTEELKQSILEIAAGLTALGAVSGDTAALYLQEGHILCRLDAGILYNGCITLPLHYNDSTENCEFILHEAAPPFLFVEDIDALYTLLPVLNAPSLRHIVVAKGSEDDIARFAEEQSINEGVTLLSLDRLSSMGKSQDFIDVKKNAAGITPKDLAVILYTSGTTGSPKGVMLTHENITFDILSEFSALKINRGYRIRILSFMPYSHITARVFFYGHLYYGHSYYFSDKTNLYSDLKVIRPHFLMAVPRILEKFHASFYEEISKQLSSDSALWKKAIEVITSFKLEKKWRLRDFLTQHWARFIFSIHIKKIFGGCLRYLLSGGAGLKSELANFFSALGMTVYQGYGLTESASTLCANRPKYNKAGTVGPPIPGIEMRITAEGEIAARGPCIMRGYFKNPRATDEVLDHEGWFYTGDIGYFTEDGFLVITDRKKNMFKLSTGKYVTPAPLEQSLERSSVINHAVVVGEGKKYCGVLIFATPKNKELSAIIQERINLANKTLPLWSRIKNFQVIGEELSVENGLLTSSFKVKRKEVLKRFARQIEDLYRQ